MKVKLLSSTNAKSSVQRGIGKIFLASETGGKLQLIGPNGLFITTSEIVSREYDGNKVTFRTLNSVYVVELVEDEEKE